MSSGLNTFNKRGNSRVLKKAAKIPKLEISDLNKSNKINSPVAKYNDQGQLKCILCNTTIKSESLWRIHVNSKTHKECVINMKKLTESLKLESPAPLTAKSIVQCDVKTQKTICSTKSGKINMNMSEPKVFNKSHESKQAEKMSEEFCIEDFFDKPTKSTNCGTLDYKDHQNEEWERFQKEIKKESNVSNAIITDEQDEATINRQIKEINQQIDNWSKVLNLVKQKENFTSNLRENQNKSEIVKDEIVDDSETDEEMTEDYSDWRTKKCYLKISTFK